MFAVSGVVAAMVPMDGEGRTGGVKASVGRTGVARGDALRVCAVAAAALGAAFTIVRSVFDAPKVIESENS